MSQPEDVIDHLVGIAPGSFLDEARRRRTSARENAQKSYEALFTSGEPGFTRAERLAVASFVVGLHRDDAIAAFYRQQIGDEALVAAVEAEVAGGRTEGPYGAYPAGPLSTEDKPGLQFRVSDAGRAALGAKLAAGLEHAHFLVFRPRDASPEKLQTLIDAGWTTTEVVTLSQLVAFLSFQIRVITGLRSLKAAGIGSVTANAAE